jgi:DNA (cytosine-5)-methyltransferase 1
VRAAVGYDRAGFDVTGVDLCPQPRYPFAFVQADAIEYLREHGHEYDAIHGSPPCQRYSKSVSIEARKGHPDLVAVMREGMIASGRPWVIENVPGAPLRNATVLCGTMFGLQVKRHRLFESSVLILSPECRHEAYEPQYPPAWNRTNPLRFIAVSGGFQRGVTHEQRCEAMGIDWANARELSEAVPPAYTEYVGGFLMDAVADERVRAEAAA